MFCWGAWSICHRFTIVELIWIGHLKKCWGQELPKRPSNRFILVCKTDRCILVCKTDHCIPGQWAAAVFVFHAIKLTPHKEQKIFVNGKGSKAFSRLFRRTRSFKMSEALLVITADAIWSRFRQQMKANRLWQEIFDSWRFRRKERQWRRCWEPQLRLLVNGKVIFCLGCASTRVFAWKTRVFTLHLHLPERLSTPLRNVLLVTRQTSALVKLWLRMFSLRSRGTQVRPTIRLSRAKKEITSWVAKYTVQSPPLIVCITSK